MINVPNGILLGHKIEEKFTLCDSMDGPREYLLSEINQSEKDNYHMVLLICGI